jgi:ech hydrogenase subunit A
MYGELIVATNVLLPSIMGLACLGLTGRGIRRAIIAITAASLIASSLLLFYNGGFVYSPNYLVEMSALILDFCLSAYFLYVGFRIKNVLVIGLTLLQLLLVAYFEYAATGVRVEPVLMVDNLSIFMNLIVNIVGSMICVYALSYMDEHEEILQLSKSRQPRFFFFLLLFLGAMNGLIYSNNILWLAFFWEVTTLCCYELIRHDRTKEAEKNAAVALWMNLIGMVALSFSLFVSYYAVGSIVLNELLVAGAAPMILLIFAFMALAAFSKSAQFPFHGWLLGAMVAPTPVSALLHASTMVNAGVYLILRIAPAIKDTHLTWAVALVGAFTFMLTAVLAISQRVSKRILAYSTIGNLGLIILCAGLNTPLAYSAALILLLFHAVSKGLLFMGAGVVENRLHSQNIESWEGLLGRFPLTAIIMIVGMISMFLPPFGMLLGKWAALEVVASSPPSIILLLIVFMVIGSAATTLFWAKWLGRLIILPVKETKLKAEKLQPPYLLSLLSLLSLDLFISVGAAFFISNLVNPTVGGGYSVQIGAPLFSINTTIGSFPVLLFWLAAGIIFIAGFAIAKSKGGVVKPPFLGGENVEGNPSAFRTVADTEAEFQVSIMSFDSIGEGRLNKYALVGGTLLLTLLFLMVIF